jgi:hypothetical protein
MQFLQGEVYLVWLNPASGAGYVRLMQIGNKRPRIASGCDISTTRRKAKSGVVINTQIPPDRFPVRFDGPLRHFSARGLFSI